MLQAAATADAVTPATLLSGATALLMAIGLWILNRMSKHADETSGKLDGVATEVTKATSTLDRVDLEVTRLRDARHEEGEKIHTALGKVEVINMSMQTILKELARKGARAEDDDR